MMLLNQLYRSSRSMVCRRALIFELSTICLKPITNNVSVLAPLSTYYSQSIDHQSKSSSSWRFLNFSNKQLLSPVRPGSWLLVSKRFMAKTKDRKKEKKTDKPKVILDEEEMEKVITFDEFKLAVDEMIDEMKNELKLNYNIRLNPRLIESLEISYDGMMVTLADIVTISRKQQELVINLAATPNAVKPALNAIIESGLNLNPQQDGTIIYIRMPKVTTEHRQALIKSVKQLGQKTKDKIKERNFQKKFFLKSDKKLSQDLVNDATANLNYYVKQRSLEIDDIVLKKSESLLNN